MTGDRHVRFCESGRGRFPPATHPDRMRPSSVQAGITAAQRAKWSRVGTGCKTVGLAYAGSNPAPATTCENVPLAAGYRPCGAFLFCPVVSHSVAPWIAVLRGARTHSGRRPGVAELGGRTDQTVKSTDGSGMPTVYVPCHASEMALQAAGSQQARGYPLAGQLTGRRLLSRPLLGSRGSAGSLMVRARGSGGTLTTRATASARGGALFVCNSCVPWLCREAGKLTMAAAGNAGAAVVRGRASHGRALSSARSRCCPCRHDRHLLR